MLWIIWLSSPVPKCSHLPERVQGSKQHWGHHLYSVYKACMVGERTTNDATNDQVEKRTLKTHVVSKMRLWGQRVDYKLQSNGNNTCVACSKWNLKKEMEVNFVVMCFCNILPLFAIKISRAVFCKR